MNPNSISKAILLALVTAAFWYLLSWHFALIPPLFALALKMPAKYSYIGAGVAFATFCAIIGFGTYAERTRLDVSMSVEQLNLLIGLLFASLLAAIILFLGACIRRWTKQS